mmetsp:Transcript_17520/g.29533  ORF Transcript_17520/g.29533 Transcript_17520/m.29533 type:complete len:147 (+) Transcript_17520:1769-2209(+)
MSKKEDSIGMFQVKYAVLEKIKPLIDQAKDLEKSIHRNKQDEKAANWMIQASKDAELDLEEGLQYELKEKLGKKAEKNMDVLGDVRKVSSEEQSYKKRENKLRQKEQSLKQKYEREMQSQKIKKISNSSFLTPEAALYLNDMIREN